MKLAAKVVGESPVVVVDAEIGGADFADAQLLLLVRAGRHRVAVLLLGQSLLLANFLNLHHLSFKLRSHTHTTRHRNNAKFLSQRQVSLTHLFHKLHALLDFSLGADLFGHCQLLSDVLCEHVHLLGLRGDLGRELLLRLQQPFLGQFRAPVAVVDEDLEVLACLRL